MLNSIICPFEIQCNAQTPALRHVHGGAAVGVELALLAAFKNARMCSTQDAAAHLQRCWDGALHILNPVSLLLCTRGPHACVFCLCPSRPRPADRRRQSHTFTWLEAKVYKLQRCATASMYHLQLLCCATHRWSAKSAWRSRPGASMTRIARPRLR
jgi:hypothetical protein